MSTTTARRPFGVSLLGIFLLVVGVVEIIAGITVLASKNDTSLLEGIDSTSSDLTTLAVVGIAFGIAVILIGSALRGGANWARYLVGLIAAFRLFSLIWVVIAYHNVQWYNAFWPMVFYGLITGYLFYDDDAVEYFERG